MLVNILLIISLFILPSGLAAISFLILIIRGFYWLFGPAQDMQDDYYYERFMNAQERYERKQHKVRMEELKQRRENNRRSKI